MTDYGDNDCDIYGNDCNVDGEGIFQSLEGNAVFDQFPAGNTAFNQFPAGMSINPLLATMLSTLAQPPNIVHPK